MPSNLSADDLHQLGHNALSDENYKGAEAYFRRELELRKDKGLGSPRHEALKNLAEAIEKQKRWKVAEQYLRIALAEAGRHAALDTELSGRLGFNLREQGRHAEAVDVLQGMRGSDERLALADSLEVLGRWADAETVLRSNRTDEGMDRLAKNLRKQGKPEQAVALEQEHVADAMRREPEGPQRTEDLRRTIATFHQLAEIAEKSGDAERAAEMKDQAAFLQAALDPSPESEGRLHDILTRRVEASKRYQRQDLERRGDTAGLKKLEDYEAALKSMEQRGPSPYGWTGFENVDVATRRAELALRQVAGGHHAEAEPELVDACPKLRQRSIVDMAAQPPAGMPVPKPPVLTATRCFAELVLLRALRLTAAGGAIDPLAFDAAQAATLNEAASAMTVSSAREFALRNGAGPILADIDTQLRAYERPAMEFMAMSLNGIAESESSKFPPVNFVIALEKMQRETHAPSLALERLVAELSLKLPAYFEMRLPQSLSVSALQARTGPEAVLLNDDEAIVLWMMPPDTRSGLVFAVSKSRAAWARMSLTGPEITSRVTLLRRQIDPCAFGRNAENCNTGSMRYDRRAAWELHQALLGSPAIQAVISPDAIKTLMIVPSGVLTTLPPALLITKEPEGGAAEDEQSNEWVRSRWLIQEKALSVLPSVSALRTLRMPPPAPVASTAPTRPDRLFMVADPAFNGALPMNAPCTTRPRSVAGPITAYFGDAVAKRKALASLDRLPCTRDEAMRLEEMLGGRVLLGADARESALRNASIGASLSNAEVVAFSTHGIVAGELGIGEPALALAAPLPGEQDDDGLLTTSEIVQMRLRADLVLLSACNTASPDAYDAGGLSGLSRAFFFAGARSVFASHWRVDDATSSQLVVDTVRQRASGVPKAQALRQSSLAMLARASQDDGHLAHPASWAPFTLIGDPR